MNPFKIRYNSNWIYVILSHWFSHQKIEIVLLTFFFFYLLKLLKRISKHQVELWRVHSEKTTQWLNPKIRWHIFHMATCRLCLWKSTACTSNHFTRSPWIHFKSIVFSWDTMYLMLRLLYMPFKSLFFIFWEKKLGLMSQFKPFHCNLKVE